MFCSHSDFALSASLSGNMQKVLKFLFCLVEGWVGGQVVSNRKLEVALSDLLKASLRPANAHGLLKAVIWKGAVLPAFTLPAAFHVTEMLWLCTAAGFCAVLQQFFVVVYLLTSCTKIHVAARQAVLLITDASLVGQSLDSKMY